MEIEARSRAHGRPWSPWAVLVTTEGWGRTHADALWALLASHKDATITSKGKETTHQWRVKKGS